MKKEELVVALAVIPITPIWLPEIEIPVGRSAELKSLVNF